MIGLVSTNSFKPFKAVQALRRSTEHDGMLIRKALAIYCPRDALLLLLLLLLLLPLPLPTPVSKQV